jgi:hypothetical protein
MNALPSTAAVTGLVRALTTAGLHVPVLGGSPGSSSIPTLQSVNSPDYFALSVYAYPLSGAKDRGVQDILTGARAMGSDPAQAFFTNGWSEGLILVQGLRKCSDPCTGAKLEKSLESLKFDTQGFTPGPMSFTTTDHQPIHAINVYQWDASRSVPKLYKADFATGNR